MMNSIAPRQHNLNGKSQGNNDSSSFEEKLVRDILSQYGCGTLHVKGIVPSHTDALKIDADQTVVPDVIDLMKRKEEIDTLLLSDDTTILKILESKIDPFIDKCDKIDTVFMSQLNRYPSTDLTQFFVLYRQTDNLLSEMIENILVNKCQKTLESPDNSGMETMTLSFALDLRLFQIHSIINFLDPVEKHAKTLDKKQSFRKKTYCFQLKNNLNNLNQITKKRNALLQQANKGEAKTCRHNPNTIIMNVSHMKIIKNAKKNAKKTLHENDSILVCSSSLDELNNIMNTINRFLYSLGVLVSAESEDSKTILIFNSNQERLNHILKSMRVCVNEIRYKRRRSKFKEYTCDLTKLQLIQVYNMLNKYF
ncbi:hypothetical protein DID74_00705 [Candidatus Marinamargulisbacteria bacterium SCGC AG-333-B06]|nr:hypothetical protein DID74_00705 [Candidatus Marinamargulisbacteria bacterium SCGC AG-333-B06]